VQVGVSGVEPADDVPAGAIAAISGLMVVGLIAQGVDRGGPPSHGRAQGAAAITVPGVVQRLAVTARTESP
jgi:hypothetical protein